MTKKFENAIKSVKPSKFDNKVPVAYDIGLEDISGLLELSMSGNPDCHYDAIIQAFLFGFVMGNRATLNNRVKRL